MILFYDLLYLVILGKVLRVYIRLKPFSIPTNSLMKISISVAMIQLWQESTVYSNCIICQFPTFLYLLFYETRNEFMASKNPT